MKITRFEDIEGWQLARELTGQVYAVAVRGAFAKDFGLRDQITRAAGSSMHNIAEGFDGGSFTLRGHARKFKASSMSPWIKLTSASKILIPSTSKLLLPTQKWAGSSAIC